MLTDVLGLEVDENHGASSVEELLDHAHSKMQQRAQSRRAEERETGRRAKRGAAEDAVRARDPARLRARLREYDLDDEPGELEAMQAMMEIATMFGDFRPPRRPRRR
jgi:spore cortex formation protein SpoVR/YcgB (stage V sporulation)